MSFFPPNELTHAKKLIDEGNHEVALKLLRDFEEIGGPTPQDHLMCKLFMCESLFQQGTYEDLLNLAEKTYKDSLKLGLNLISVDALMWKARALIYLFRLDDISVIIEQGEELLKKLIQELPTEYKQREATIAFVKGLFNFWEKHDTDMALEQLEHSLTLREKFGSKSEIILTYMQIAKLLILGKGEFNRAIKYLERGMNLAKEINNKYNIAWGYLIMGVCHALRGEQDESIQLNEQSLRSFKELNNKNKMARAFNNLGIIYKMKGDLDRALKFLEKGLAVRSDIGSIREIASCYDPLIRIYIQKDDLEQAQRYLDNMEKLIMHLKDKQINRWYLFDKALILKRSLRAYKRVEAEEILTQIIEEEDSDYELIVNALLNLCELLLAELEITNETEVLEEVQSVINQLIENAKKSHSYWIWGEAFLLQAKLALLSLNLKEARRFLTQGQKIAEKYGLKLLAIKISNEHDELLRHLNIWEKLKESETSLPERMKLARLNEQMENMIRERRIKTPELSDEQPVLLLIVSEGGMPFFSHSFIEDKAFEDHLFGGFFTTINSFIHEKFSEGLDLASFGKHTLLMDSIPPFLICYVYKGQSYSAQKRIKSFINKIKDHKEVWDKFQRFFHMNKKIQIEDIPFLESLIKETFIARNIAFNE